MMPPAALDRTLTQMLRSLLVTPGLRSDELLAAADALDEWAALTDHNRRTLIQNHADALRTLAPYFAEGDEA